MENPLLCKVVIYVYNVNVSACIKAGTGGIG